MAISSFIERWHTANQTTEEAERLKQLIEKHFGKKSMDEKM